MKPIVRIAALCIFALVPLTARAHSGSTSYIHITEGDTPGISVALDLRDLEYVVGLDANADRAITWGEVSSREAAVKSYVVEHLVLSRGGPKCALTLVDLRIDNIDDGVYALLSGTASCPRDGASAIRSTMLFDVDAEHRSLVEWSRSSTQSLAVLTNTQRTSEAPGQDARPLAQLIGFATEGMWHIWSGFDHLAFLLILLLPAAAPALVRPAAPALLRPQHLSSCSAQRLDSRPASIGRRGGSRAFDWRKLFSIVTAFTFAHSITLALAVTRVVSLPDRPIEIGIAISVIVAALSNLWPRARSSGVSTAFAFGLLHGFGFASALRGLEASQESFALALFGFNLGVEAGQLIVVATVLPVLLFVRASSIYASRIVPAASLIVAAIGAVWVWERALS